MLNGVKPELTDDDARWVEAESLLARRPTESAEQRLRRWRRFRVLFVLGAALLGIALGVVLFVLLDVGTQPKEEVPTWQVVAGLSIASAGLVLQIFGVVTLLRTNRRLGAWRSPLSVLTRPQRKDLLAQVRGRRPVEPARLPIARMLAEQLIAVRMVVVSNLGLGVAAVGQAIAFPTMWRFVLVGVFALLVAVGWPFVRRDVRRGRHFLGMHPPDAD
jgi:hypothetical protein